MQPPRGIRTIKSLHEKSVVRVGEPARQTDRDLQPATARQRVHNQFPGTHVVLVAECKAIKRRTPSLVLFPTLDGQPYTDSGFKCLWNRLMHSYVKAGGVWFHARDLRAMYVSLTLAAGGNPNTHQNEETMRRVYDWRDEITITPLG